MSGSILMEPTPSHDLTSSEDQWSDKSPERGYHRQERFQNEAESLRYIRRVSDVPVPTLYGSIEVDGVYLLIMEYIDGVGMFRLSEDQKKLVLVELKQFIDTLHRIRLNKIGGPTGAEAETPEYVFCHNDLSQHNIIVDPKTLKIKAIIDWEYAGFFPEYFDAPFYKRIGPSAAIDEETDDVPKLLQFLNQSKSNDSHHAKPQA
ncbi:uncharacterized protein N7483_006575 [Penicillium malachiteum]|uniref:uncharacterized protein n=1 Tax=Penicillium malachiteum TaxID=1324776 RepID=UPI0025499847|nr:uncharacterized protein N7483_006575 [Penicillium malachiteum]KAJ5725218.1 hypothetical protein N7483_006575 [Penicillium malachiteum]